VARAENGNAASCLRKKKEEERKGETKKMTSCRKCVSVIDSLLCKKGRGKKKKRKEGKGEEEKEDENRTLSGAIVLNIDIRRINCTEKKGEKKRGEERRRGEEGTLRASTRFASLDHLFPI